MPQKPNPRQMMTQKEFKEFWKTLPESDRRFFRTMVILQQALGLKDLHYRVPSAQLEKRLKRCDCNTLFSILVECVGILTRTPVVHRIKEIHRERRRGSPAAANAK